MNVSNINIGMMSNVQHDALVRLMKSHNQGWIMGNNGFSMNTDGIPEYRNHDNLQKDLIILADLFLTAMKKPVPPPVERPYVFDQRRDIDEVDELSTRYDYPEPPFHWGDLKI